MKKALLLSCFAFVFCCGIAVSCQDEEHVSENEEQVLGKTSNLTKLLRRVAMSDSDFDNVIDSTDCFSVQLPVNAIVNGQSIVISSEEDYEVVADIFAAGSTTGYNQIDFVFPLTVEFPDYTTQVVTSEQQFYALQHSCGITGPVDEEPVGCVTVQYPVTIYGYNANFQLANTYTIHNDAELFLLIGSLTGSVYYSIAYPISLINSTGNLIEVHNNAELETVINQAIDNCISISPLCPNPDVLHDSLIVYIPFANELVDLTGKTQPTVTGGYHYVTDRSGNPNAAFSLDDGTNNAMNTISVPTGTQSDLMQTGSFTVSFWFRRQDNSGANPHEQIASNYAFTMMLGHTQISNSMGPWIVNEWMSDPVYDNSWIDQQLLSDIQNWHHMVITYDGGQNLMRMYRNGELRRVVSPPQMPATVPMLTFGNRYKGFLDDIRAYKYALNPAQVHTLYMLEGDNYTCM